MVLRLLLALVLLAGVTTPALANHTVLHTAATNTGVGAWSQLPTGSTPGWNNGQIIGPNGGSNCTVLQYQGKAVWNTVANRYQVAAAAHGDGGACGPSNKTIVYTDSNSTWSEGPQLQGGSDPQHMYDQNGMMPNGTHIASGYNSEAIKLWTTSGGSWTTLATVPTDSSIPVGEANVYFPDYPGGAKIIHLSPAWGVWIVDPTTGATSCIGRTSAGGSGCSGKPQLAGTWGDHNVSATYTVLCHCVMLGSTGAWVRLDNTGAFTTMSQSGGPSGYGSGDSIDSPGGQFAVDPVSGKILMLSVQNPGDGAMRQFDPTAGSTGTWTTVMANGSLPAIFQTGQGSNGAACTGVPLYNVIMCVKSPDGQNWPGAQVWIYKHTATGPVNPTLTVVKAGTGTGTVSGGTINCGVTCTQQAASGTVITLSAATLTGTFSGWSGGTCSGPGNCVVTLNADTTITATFQGAVAPAQPTTFLSTPYVNPTGTTITVPDTGNTVTNGTNFQNALNSAIGGQKIVLTAGVTYTGNFTLPNKAGSTYIYVESSALSAMPENLRVTPTVAGSMPKLVSSNTSPVLSAVAGTHHFRFVGIEITTTHAVTTSTNANLVLLDAPGGATTLAQSPNNMVFDRCYIHGTATGNVRRGLLLNGSTMAVVDSYISNIHEVGNDSQAIAAWNGAGPFKITNNYLEGSGENVLFGGADPQIPNLVPSDIEMRKNYLFKPLTWKADDPSYAGIPWSVKNLLELKNAQRVLIDGNLLENNWLMAQNGFGVLFTPRNQDGTAPWSTVRDVTFTNNTLRHSGGGINMQGTDNLQVSLQTQRILVQNNLLDDISSVKWNGTGDAMQIADSATDVVINHNTLFSSRFAIVATSATALTPPPVPSFAQQVRWEYRNTIVVPPIFGDYGVGNNNLAIAGYFPASVWTNNVFVGGTASQFPNGNFFPATQAAVGYTNQAGGNYALTTSSPFHNAATDGTDIGADFVALAAAQAPPAQTATITIQKLGTGSGTVSSVSNPNQLAQINCGATCAATYPTTTQVTLTAGATAGSTFAGWSGGGCTGVGTCVLTPTASVTITATFNTLPAVTLTVTKNGTGSGTVTSVPPGINCGATCAAGFTSGSSVTLAAQPIAGSLFVSWSGGGCSGAGSCVIPSLTVATTVTATFNVSGGGGGADQDFTNRCNAALATGGRCFHFDDVSQIPTANGQDCWGCNFGAFAPGQNMPVIDTTNKASGAGSLKFVTPALSGSSGGGSWFTNLSNPASTWQIGPGDDLWVQYRYMPSAATLSLSNSNVPIASSPGFKLSHVGDGDTPACNTGTGKSNANCPGSCSDMEVVVQPNWDSTGGNRLGAYTTCNNGTVGQPIMTVTRDGGATYDRHPNWTGTPARSCNYPGPYNEPKCFAFRANEWHTIKYHIHVNAWNTWTNTIQIWAGHQGEALQLLINCAPGVNCSDNNNATVQGFFLYNSDTALYKMGKIWLDPYVTRQGVDAPGPLAPTTAWFDELIMSKQDIADPGTTSTPPAPVLTVTKTGAGSGTVSSVSNPNQVAQINCGATCTQSFPSGTLVTLTASPAVGSSFSGWSGGSCSGVSPCPITLTADTTVTANFTLPSQQFGLQWDGTGSVRRQMMFSNPPPIYPWTYIFQAFPQKKTVDSDQNPPYAPGVSPTGYYTMFFWGNNGNFAWNGGSADTYYGMHPYPIPPPTGAGHWEISVFSGDTTAPAEVAWDRWYTQVIRVRFNAATSTYEHEFYYDWNTANPPTTCSAATSCLSQPVQFPTWAQTNPPFPSIQIGQTGDLNGPSPAALSATTYGTSWGGYPGWEEYKGILRGFQFYTNFLSLTDINAEILNPKSTTAGATNIWYLNINPRPTDITDKKATGTPHNFIWDPRGTTAVEWTNGGTGPTPPAPPSGLRIGP